MRCPTNLSHLYVLKLGFQVNKGRPSISMLSLHVVPQPLRSSCRQWKGALAVERDALHRSPPLRFTDARGINEESPEKEQEPQRTVEKSMRRTGIPCSSTALAYMLLGGYVASLSLSRIWSHASFASRPSSRAVRCLWRFATIP